MNHLLSHDEEHWDLVIEPKTKLLDLKLRELWRYRDLLILWVRRSFVGTYKQTLMGPLWHFISPIFGTLSYMLIFGRIARLPTDGIPMFLFYNSGIIAWTFFAACFGSSSNTFLGNSALFGKVYFPRLIMPLSDIVSSLIKFGIQMSLFLVIYFYLILFQGYHPQVGWGLLLIPLSLLLFAGIGFGSGIMVSSVTTKYRDVGIIVGFSLQVLMYATPVIYSFNKIDPGLKHYLSFNPLVAPMEAFRFAFFGKGDFSFFSLLYSFCWMLVFMFCGIVLFNKTEKNFMDTV